MNKENLNTRERKCVALGVGMGVMKRNFNKKKHQDTQVENKNFCYNVTSLATVDMDERMALRHQRNRRNVPKMHRVRYFNRDGKLNAMTWRVSE